MFAGEFPRLPRRFLVDQEKAAHKLAAFHGAAVFHVAVNLVFGPHHFDLHIHTVFFMADIHGAGTDFLVLVNALVFIKKQRSSRTLGRRNHVAHGFITRRQVDVQLYGLGVGDFAFGGLGGQQPRHQNDRHQ